ncbi:hypothetical protein ACH5RR_013447 [Cinchona calisaya]|uniref:Retrovirus-related Pol polyprotein from transposon TNT 1-94-like beta-barrel domain-containing protein n=1 Tax=Cinchona calisaya TaxID=153742 RepID=A0ABD3A3G1_9GENT
MSSSKLLFKDLNEAEKSTVQLGDDKVILVEGKGTIAIKTNHSNTKLLNDVQYVPGLAYNLLSVGQLMANVSRILFDNDPCSVKDKKLGHTIVNVQMAQNKMFPLEASQVNNSAFVVSKIGSLLHHIN